MIQKKDFSIQKARRNELLESIKREYDVAQESLVLLVAGFETDRTAFWQEGSFLYYTDITEAATAMTLDFANKTSLYIPNCGEVREKWIYSPLALTQENAKQLGVDTVKVLGDKCAGYQLFPFFKAENYSAIISRLKKLVADGAMLFTLYPKNEHEYVEQRLVINHLSDFVPGLKERIVDISAIVADMRRRKDMDEITKLSKAIEITELAHEAAAQAIKAGMLECEVQASLEYMMIGAESRPSFPSIVATGKNATILHYMANNAELKDGDLVVVDIGSVFEGYCSDITRTYPVSGKFTARQKELYNLVLDVQTYIADNAKPGMYLRNAEHPEQSLHHLALHYFKERGYEKYFIHGIGHFLGLDVHDVGDVTKPLQENDVFTIEPGLYIPEEGIGIRIEDDYWMGKKGCISLSENLPKTAQEIEALVQQQFEDDSLDRDDDDDDDIIDFSDLRATEH